MSRVYLIIRGDFWPWPWGRLKNSINKEGDAFNVPMAQAAVNISCTLDISHRVSKRFFTEKDVEEASNALVFAPPDWRGINFGELATCLREKGFNGLVRRISKLSERFFNIAEPDVPRNPEESEESLPEMWLQTLDVVRYLASKIGPGSSFNVQDPSEADLVFLWRELLCGMAPDGFMTMS